MPSKAKELKHFLGAVAFYHRCIPPLSATLEPLYKLQSRCSKKNELLTLDCRQREAFEKAKQALIVATPLAIPQSGVTFVLTTDASKFAIGSVIKQKGRPLAYYSRTLTDTEKRYSTFDREFLAIYLSVKHFKYMLDGSPIIFYTDHKPLISVMNIKESSNRQWRWINFLQQFNIVFRQIRGEENVMADFFITSART